MSQQRVVSFGYFWGLGTNLLFVSSLILAFFLLFAWYIFFNPNILFFFFFLFLKWAPCREHRIESFCYTQSNSVCLLLGGFRASL